MSSELTHKRPRTNTQEWVSGTSTSSLNNDLTNTCSPATAAISAAIVRAVSNIQSHASSQIMTFDASGKQDDGPQDKVRPFPHHHHGMVQGNQEDEDNVDVRVILSDCGSTLRLRFMDHKSRTMLDDEVIMSVRLVCRIACSSNSTLLEWWNRNNLFEIPQPLTMSVCIRRISARARKRT
jgi:hypothetical protein